MTTEDEPTATCRMQKFYCETRRLQCKSELIWEVEGLADQDLYRRPAKVLQSPDFRLDRGREFRVIVKTESQDSTEEGGVVGLFLHYVKGPECLVALEFSFSDASGHKPYVGSLSKKLAAGESWGYPKFITRQKLFNQQLKLIHDNAVTVCCVVTLGEVPKTSQLSFHPLRAERSTTESDLPSAWKIFYDQKLNTDIVLKVGDAEIAAHKAVLMCRSPVFAAMLQHDMREKSSNEVNIQDISCGVFDDMLRYMYTGEFIAREVGFIAKLLVAADRYDVQSLKRCCSDYLCAKVALHDLVEVLKITELCSSEELDKRCLNLVDREMFSAGSLSEWMKDMRDLPEVLRLLRKRLFNEDRQTV